MALTLNKLKEKILPTVSLDLPLGQQPEGNLDSLGRLEEAMKSLFNNLDELQKNLKKLTEENNKLKELLNIYETVEDKKDMRLKLDVLKLTPDMEVKDGHK
tara:strand:- start:4231 stop:4533 length:303 start_codon:yes stop_codon:yes gene_type:complete